MTPAGWIERNQLWTRLTTAVEHHPEDLPTPVVVVDLDAFEANAADLARRAGRVPIRVASKSLRVPDLIKRALALPGYSGVLAYTLREALWLHSNGISDDIVVAYPSVDRGALRQLSTDPAAAEAITLMIDDAVHLDLADLHRSPDVTLRVALDIDAGLRIAGQHVGPKRSPLFEADAVVEMARTVLERDGFRLVGVMTYEGQVAGVPDDVPGQRARSSVVRRLKQASLTQLAQRRGELRARLTSLTPLEFWNAGGSGSVEGTADDDAVTEVAAGSGLLVPGLFDHYRSFEPRPAAFYGLRVSRRPSDSTATVHGGGFVASGPTGADRAPLPWAPPGLALTGLEGAGEVQTPLTGHPAAVLRIGDLVWFRHAKSGELFEHTPTAHLVRGDRIVDSAPTYRGAGQSF